MIFSIFGRKNAGKKPAVADKKSAKEGAAPAGSNPNTDSTANSIMTQRHIARATERKIDAIEYEMSRDIIKTKSEPQPDPLQQQTNANINLFDDDLHSPLRLDLPTQTDHFETTIPLIGAITQYLLGANTVAGAADTNASLENIPALEEAAILFANQQIEAAELLLQNLIQNNNYNALNSTAWLMLFDLYQITDNRAKFEQLSLDYAKKLEISAPIWIEPQTPQIEKVEDGFIPGISFSGKLNADISKQIDKLSSLTKQHKQVRLEFVRIAELNVEGCEQLLKGFQTLKKSHIELTVVGANDLIALVRSLVAVGRRDDSQAPWLLLLELFQLTHNESAFEETSIDYCITYEVSPPSFEAPKNKATTPSVGISVEFVEPDRFALPQIIIGNTSELVSNISAFAQKNYAVRLDCSQLDRIDFSSCGQLLTGLMPLSKQLNVTLEFHDVNHLVIALLNAMGFKNIAVIFPRKR